MKKSFFVILSILGAIVLVQAAGVRPALAARRGKRNETDSAKQGETGQAEERRRLHLTIMKVLLEDVDEPQSRVSLGITHKANPKVISRYVEKKHQTGVYMRTQFNVLICESSPCEQVWSAGFVYTDEMGKSDTFGLTWKQTVFDGITPKGTFKREVLYCLNGQCENLEDSNTSDASPVVAELGRYQLTWARHSLVIRRSDIVKEIMNAGGSVEAY